MKTWFLALCVVVVMGSAQAGFKLPSSAFTVEQWDEAVAKAKEQNKPIAVMMSDTESGCPLCSGASSQIITALRTPAVLVYVKDWNGIPRQAKGLLMSAERGEYIPWVGVMDADMTKLLGMVTYEQITDEGNRAFIELKREITAAKKS